VNCGCERRKRRLINWMIHTPQINPLGWVVLAALAGTAAYFLTHPAVAKASALTKWIPAHPLRQGVTQVLWNAQSDDWFRGIAPASYDVESNEWVFVINSVEHRHPVVKIWGYR